MKAKDDWVRSSAREIRDQAGGGRMTVRRVEPCDYGYGFPWTIVGTMRFVLPMLCGNERS